MHKPLGLLAALAVLASAQVASADDLFGSKGQFAFGIDRAFGFYGYHASYEQTWPYGKIESSQGGTMINFLWGNGGTDRGEAPGGTTLNPFATPRVAFDYFVADHWSIGGTIAYAHTGGEFNIDNAPRGVPLNRYNLADTNLFDFGFRAGFAYMFTPVIGLWPRLGFTYGYFSSETRYQAGGKTKTSGYVFDLDVEGMLAIVPFNHVAILVGPVIDIPLAGNASVDQSPAPANTTPDTSVHFWNYGIAAGLVAFF